MAVEAVVCCLWLWQHQIHIAGLAAVPAEVEVVPGTAAAEATAARIAVPQLAIDMATGTSVDRQTAREDTSFQDEAAS